jgi:chemotaxis signal transduction protein
MIAQPPSSNASPADAVLLVQLGERRFGLPLAAVERVLPMAALVQLPDSAQGLIGVLNLHGDIVPVIDPRPRLGLPTPAIDAEQRLVLIRGNARFLLWVDAIDEVVPSANAMSTVPGQQVNPLVSRVIRLGETILPVLAPAVLEPRTGVAR